MRIAFVSFETVYHDTSEANERLQTVLESLRDHGHDVHVLCAQFWSGEKSTLERDGIVYHGVAVELEAKPSFLLRLPFVLRSVNPDIVHASAHPPGQVLAANWGATLARAPLFVEWYDTDARSRWHEWAVRKPDRIITPSRLVETRIRELGAVEEQVTVIPNSIDFERIQQITPRDRVDIVYARRLDEGANLESLLLALAELRTRDWETVVIGDGPEREMYEQLARDFRVEDRVRFVGERSLEDRLSIYRSAHVFAQTAEECVFPTEMLWALAAGCVGIIEYHANSSAHELVEGWPRGFRTTSEQELATAILEAGDLEYRDYDDRFARFDHSAVADQYLERYRDDIASDE